MHHACFKACAERPSVTTFLGGFPNDVSVMGGSTEPSVHVSITSTGLKGKSTKVQPLSDKVTNASRTVERLMRLLMKGVLYKTC